LPVLSNLFANFLPSFSHLPLSLSYFSFMVLYTYFSVLSFLLFLYVVVLYVLNRNSRFHSHLSLIHPFLFFSFSLFSFLSVLVPALSVFAFLFRISFRFPLFLSFVHCLFIKLLGTLYVYINLHSIFPPFFVCSFFLSFFCSFFLSLLSPLNISSELSFNYLLVSVLCAVRTPCTRPEQMNSPRVQSSNPRPA